MIYLDTHILVWLFNGSVEKIPPKVQQLIDSHDILASPMSVLELQYLYEIKRITIPSQSIIDDLTFRIGLILDDNPMINIIQQSLMISWTRDPFDRLIAASAQLRGIPLLTKDETILTNCPTALWD